MNGLLRGAVSLDWDAVPPDSYLRAIPALGVEGALPEGTPWA